MPQRKRTKRRVFNKNDYLSGNGMLTSVWGPAMWHYLHTMSFNYPVSPTEIDKKHYQNFILSLQHVLPCKYCRINLTTNLKTNPLTAEHMRSRETFSKYIYQLHETINTMLGKKSGLTYEKVKERYEHFRARCTPEQTVERILPAPIDGHKKGCTEPLYGKKAKCVLRIVPQENKETSFYFDRQCIKKRRRASTTRRRK